MSSDPSVSHTLETPDRSARDTLTVRVFITSKGTIPYPHSLRHALSLPLPLCQSMMFRPPPDPSKTPATAKLPFRVRVRFHPIPSTLPLRPSLILHNPNRLSMKPDVSDSGSSMSHPLRFLRSPHCRAFARLLVPFCLSRGSFHRAPDSPGPIPNPSPSSTAFELRGILDFARGEEASVCTTSGTGRLFWIEANRTIDWLPDS